MGFSTLFWALQLSLASAATLDERFRAYSDSSVFRPVGIAVGTGYSSETSTVKTFKLNSASSFATIDYGTERAGLPFFDVVKVDRPLQIEVKYSEAFPDLQSRPVWTRDLSARCGRLTRRWECTWPTNGRLKRQKLSVSKAIRLNSMPLSNEVDYGGRW